MLRASRTVPAPAPRAWACIATYVEWTRWGLSISEVEASGDTVAPGRRGRVKTRFGLWVPFEITDVEPGRAWRWKVAGVDATGHRVAPSGSGSRVTFTAPWWAPGYLPILHASLRALERCLTADPSIHGAQSLAPRPGRLGEADQG